MTDPYTILRAFGRRLNRLPFDIHVWLVLMRVRILTWRLRMGERIDHD